MFVGSCFSENIGNKLKELKFKTDINPAGIVYNPLSAGKVLNMIMARGSFTKNNLHFFNGLWFSYYHHSRFSDNNADSCLKKINDRIIFSNKFLKNANFLFISFGTAWVYEHKKLKIIVSNCHKIPSKNFRRFLLNTDDIVNEYEDIIIRLKQLNPDINIIFTVSPVRHWQDGAENNQLSKSTLILAVHQIKNKFQNVYYFPSYEIMMDDLRDYRFYDQDMIHLNQAAINYIWNIFQEVYLNNEAKQIFVEIEKLIKSAGHIPFNPESESYQIFVKENLDKIKNLKLKYSFLNLEKESEYFNSKIIKNK